MMEDKIFELYDFIADRVVDMKTYVEHMQNPEDRDSMELDIIKIRDACTDIKRAYDSIDEIMYEDNDDG